MGKYIGQSDIEDVFGIDNVAIWSNLDNSSDAADAGRVQKAIEYAEEEVENRFRESRYTVPFVGLYGDVPRVLKDWMAKIAGVWLFECRPKVVDDEEVGFADMQEKVDISIDAYLSGQRRLALVLSKGRSPTSPVAV